MFLPPFPLGRVFPSGYQVMVRVLGLAECPQERRNVLRPQNQQANFMLHILHAVGVQHGHIYLASLEELGYALGQQDTRGIKVDRVEVTQLRLAKPGVNFPASVAEFFDKMLL